MTTIRRDDFIQSIADALQFISYYHPADFIRAMGEAHARERSPAARDAMAQILVNSRMCAEGHRPICQDTGIVVVFLRIGMEVRWESGVTDIQEMVDEGVRRAYLLPENKLRASVLADPAGKRRNTRDNTPAVVHTTLVPGDRLEVSVAAKGGGSENKSKFVMLNPSDSIVDWVLKTVPTMGAGWCPPGILGLGIGGTAEKAMVLAKEALMEHIDIHELQERGPSNRIEELRLELAAEYLVMAAMLAEIKSRMLLPRSEATEEDEDDPRAELVRRLQEYEQFKQAALDVDALERMERDNFPAKSEVPDLKVQRLPPPVDLREVLDALREVMQRADLFTHHRIERESLSMRERMSRILEQIGDERFTEFPALFDIGEGRMGVVVTFMAVLELMKSGLIELVQAAAFGVIHVKAKVGEA